MTRWTTEQQLAIDKEGTNIIVSAGAGSGKTAVLTERVIRKLRDGVDINHLLVLTFTKAAASEMKDRIRKSIKKEGMVAQLDYIDSAYITTFDSFAQSIVKKYHYILNITSNIKIVDDSVLYIKKQEIINNIFESRYGNKSFDNMIDCYCEKDDKSLQNNILAINNKLDLKSNKIDYLNNYINEFYNETNINNLLNEYENIVIKKVKSIDNILSNIEAYSDDKFYNNILEVITPLINSRTYTEIKNNCMITLPRLVKAEDELKNYKSELSSTIKGIQELCFYSYDDLKNNLLLTKDNVIEIIDIIKKLDKKIYDYKLQNDSFEFTDIAKMAIKIVRDNKEVKEELKQYFNEIMVDEYQDTSDLQEEFINLISNNNVYMVGDIKQSIYRFRHANPEIFRNKYNNYSVNNGGFKIDLLKNFRSRDEVLNNINLIFDSVMDEKIGNANYQASHRMIFGNNTYVDNKASQNYDLDILNYKKDDKYKLYKDEEIEAFIIANDIKNKYQNHYQVLDKETNQLRNFDYGDACIIMDRGSAFDTYKKIFEFLSIPLVVWQDEYLNNSDDIAVIKNLISLIIKINKNELDQKFRYYFTSIARSYLFEYSDNEIFDYFVNKNFNESVVYKISKTISDQLNDINSEQLLDLIIDKFNIYENMIKLGNIKKSIIRLDNFKNLFSSLSSLGYTPYDLVNYFEKSTDIDQKYSLNTKVPGNVNLMNIHKSKGLEFSVCYFSGFAKKFNDSDMKENFIYDDKYGIIVPFYKDGIGSTIQKDLFKNKYNLEDISERIRLLYVGVTRAKEKMIIVSSLNDNENIVTNVVDDNIRIKYKSFLDIINSVKSKLNNYIIDEDLDKINITKDYDLVKLSNYKECIDNISDDIQNIELNIESNVIEESHFSKVSHKLNTKEEIDNMKYGTYMHYLFETSDFTSKDNEKIIQDFIQNIDSNCKIYKEYEFMYDDDNNIKHGIIDLMLEYSDHIDIIDYKLKHIVDDNYKKQIKGYKDYIELKTNKPVNTYLYSIMDKTLKEIK